MEKKIMILAIAIIMVSLKISAQQCDCDKLEIYDNNGTVNFSAQEMTQINFPDGTTTTTYHLCVYTAHYIYTKRTYVCGNMIFCELISWAAANPEFTMICDGQDQGQDPAITGLVKDKISNAFSSDLQNYFRNNMGCTPMQGGAMTVNGKCMAHVDVLFPPNANCPGQVIGEGPPTPGNPTGTIIGTLYPPSSMYVDCETVGCCTVDGLGNKDGSGVSCGNIDLTSVRWESPCGTFFGNVTNILKPCQPTCGDEGTAFLKMGGNTKGTQGKLAPIQFTKSINSSQKQEYLYVFSVKNNGSTLHISEIKNVKQINIFDLSGKKGMEIKNITSQDIDISHISGKVLLIQVITNDNKILSGNKIQR